MARRRSRAPVAQGIEQRPSNPPVGGSIPSWGTKRGSDLRILTVGQSLFRVKLIESLWNSPGRVERAAGLTITEGSHSPKIAGLPDAAGATSVAEHPSARAGNSAPELTSANSGCTGVSAKSRGGFRLSGRFVVSLQQMKLQTRSGITPAPGLLAHRPGSRGAQGSDRSGRALRGGSPAWRFAE
jgi:hypothetical protein